MKIKIQKSTKNNLIDIQELSNQLSIYPFPRRFGAWFEEKNGAKKRINEMIVAIDAETKRAIGYLTFNTCLTKVDMDTLIIHRGYRRQGIGKMLVNHFCDKVAKNIRKKHKNITKITAGSYKCFFAKGFYIKMGFKEVCFSKLQRSIMDWWEFEKDIKL
jgi:GNAT superfamily N-acetyltransferase